MKDNSVLLRPSLTLMDQTSIGLLHLSATTILEATGLNVHHPGLRQRLMEGGARLGEGPRVYITSEMVEQALGTARRDIVIYNRLGEPAMSLGPPQVNFGTGSDLVYTNDVATMQRRTSHLTDVAQASRLCDALDEIDFVMSFALPQEVPNEVAEPQQYLVMLTNTVKPVIMTSFSGLEALERVHAMACLVAGSDEAFRARPNYLLYGQFISPLQHDQQALDRLVFCADHEIPLIYIPTIMPGASGPLTLAGSLALAAAETLAGLVMHQIQRPGAPFVFGACVSQLDMRTMLFPYGSPEWRLNDLVMAELARYYGLPVFGTGGASDSKLVDAQAGAEYANSLLVAALAGTNLIHDVGYLDSGLTGSLESIVLGADQIRWVKQFLAGVELTDETLALDVIADVGPAETFLAHRHTLYHLRRIMWSPYVADRGGYDQWIAAGAADYAARARAHAVELMTSHQPLALGDALRRELSEVAMVEQ
jgi:trimethylamine--corrinoid protein Co-methyltransferase